MSGRTRPAIFNCRFPIANFFGIPGVPASPMAIGKTANRKSHFTGSTKTAVP
jgi:hypothetical protein